MEEAFSSKSGVSVSGPISIQCSDENSRYILANPIGLKKCKKIKISRQDDLTLFIMENKEENFYIKYCFPYSTNGCEKCEFSSNADRGDYQVKYEQGGFSSIFKICFGCLVHCLRIDLEKSGLKEMKYYKNEFDSYQLNHALINGISMFKFSINSYDEDDDSPASSGDD